LKKAGGEIDSAQADHFLIRVYRRPHSGGVRPRQDARVCECHHRDSTATDNDVVEVRKTDHRQGKRWQSLRQRAENLHAGGSVEIQYAHHNSRGDDREQKAGNSLVGFQQKNRGECAGAHCE
jgi:hypothetical protein